MHCLVTENGEHGASTILCMANGDGSWKARMHLSLSRMISSSDCTTLSGGRPPSLRDLLMLPRVGEKRMPSLSAASNCRAMMSPSKERGYR